MVSAFGILLALTAQEDGLKAAAEKAAAMANYSFHVAATREDATGGGKGGKPMDLSGKVDGGVCTFVTDRFEAVRKGETLLLKGQDGNWSKVEAPTKGGGKPEGGADKGQRGAMMLRGMRAPHEELAGIESKFKEVTKSDEGGTTVYSGALTEEGAAQLGGPGRRAGGGQSPLAYDGSAKVWVDAQGSIVKYELTIHAKGKLRDKEIDSVTTKTVEISEVGATKLEVPEEAAKLLP